MTKKVDIGLDIGIASVGWAITDIDTLDIKEYGVRLFPTVDNEKDSKLKNEKRREARGLRRQVNRKRTLKRDFIKFLLRHHFVENLNIESETVLNEFKQKQIDLFEYDRPASNIPNLLKLRLEATKQNISKNELIMVLYWYMNHRGFKYEVAGSSDQKETKELKDKYEIEDKLPVVAQIDFFKENGFLNGSFNRIFHSNDYLREIDLIFSNQKLTTEFKDEFKSLFKRQRSFEDGPGNELTKTKYGRYYELKEVNGEKKIVKRLEELENIWSATIGKCTFYPNENRAPKKSLTSQIFNLLNELNNIHIDAKDGYLNDIQKREIINIALSVKSSSNKIRDYLLKTFFLDKDQVDSIKGCITDPKGNPKFTHLETYHTLKKILPIDFSELKVIFDGDKLIANNVSDRIVNVFSSYKSIEKRKTALSSEFNKEFRSEIIDKLSQLSFSASNTHSLSYKAMRNMIPDLIREPRMNQMTWATINGISFRSGIDYGDKYLKTEWIEKVIATPTVKRAFRQTTKVLNAIFDLVRRKGFQIRSIVIEMARETKNQDTRNQQKNWMKYLEEKRSDIRGFIEKLPNSSFEVSNTTVEKIWLLEQQNGMDAYTGKPIKAEELILKPHLFDIDHIIPRSQSFSNGRSNKVLTLQQNNHIKSNNTPYQYLSNENFIKMSALWEQWYKNPRDIRFKDSEKYDFLTTKLDYSKPENQIGFIQRNLVDTRYVTKEIYAALKAFSDNPRNSYAFTVKAINGKMTSFARNKISLKISEYGEVLEQLKRPEGLPLFEYDEKLSNTNSGLSIKPTRKKSRIWNGHHAEDAYIVTVLNSHYNDSKMIEKIINSPIRFDILRTNKLGERDNNINNNYKNLLQKFEIARDKLNDKMKDIRFSRMIERKTNTKLFNETLYRGKIVDGKVDKYSYKYLLSKEFKASEFFGDSPKNREKLPMYKYNVNLYNALNDIYNNYKDGNKNPFIVANEEVGGNGKHIVVHYRNNKGKQSIANVSRINYLVQENKNPLRIIKAKSNGNSFYESLEWVAMHIYKDKAGRYKLILVDASNHKFVTNSNTVVKLEEITEVLNKQKLEKNIDLDTKPECVLYKGDLIELSNNEGIAYVVGHVESADKIEIKFINRQKMPGEKDRDRRAINSKLLGSSVVKTNILGDKFKKKFTF